MSNDFRCKSFREGQRVALKASGYTDSDIARPLIGIVNTYNEAHPGHCHYASLLPYIRKGINLAGGVAAEFGTISICDAMSAPHRGENYVLPSRDVIADSVEVVVRSEGLDGIIMIASCDKIVPGLLMAAARLDIPCVMVLGGPMLSVNNYQFNGRKPDLTSYPEAFGMRTNGTITKEKFDAITDIICPTCGSCQFMGTANSMCCFAEAVGLALPGSSMIPAVYNTKKHSCEQAGEAVVELVKKNITARQIITIDSIKNGIAVAQATGASTNLVIHAVALAHEIGVPAEQVLPLFNEFKDKTPLVAHVNPNADWDMEDFHKAGGVPRVMKAIERVLNTDCLTVTGKTVKENLESYNFLFPEDPNVIRGWDDALEPTGGLVVMHGNLAPDSCVAKPSGILPKNRIFTGPARVFDGERAYVKALEDDLVKPGDVAVIRYEGPKGGPGAREMGFVLKMMKGKNLMDKVAVITDGRYSGTNNGCFVGHVSPEAAEGGPIAIVRDGDMITIDTVEARAVTLHLSEEEIAARLAEWKYEPKKLSGVIARYVTQVQSLGKGAVLES